MVRGPGGKCLGAWEWEEEGGKIQRQWTTGKGLKESLLIVKTEVGLGMLLGWCDNVTNGVQNSPKVGLHKTIIHKIKHTLEKTEVLLRSCKSLLG